MLPTHELWLQRKEKEQTPIQPAARWMNISRTEQSNIISKFCTKVGKNRIEKPSKKKSACVDNSNYRTSRQVYT